MAMLLPDLFPRHYALARRGMPAVAAAAAIAVLSGASGGSTVSCTVSAGPGKEPVTCSARNFELDYKTNLMHLSGDVKISQGDVSVAADAAEATIVVDSKNSHWVFTGNVHVRAESEGDMRADRATVEITNGALASARATGSPAQFEQTRTKNGNLATGHASTADYDVGAGTVTLTGDALLSLSDGQNVLNVLKAPSLTYNVRSRQIQGASNPASGERGHMTVTPKSKTNAGIGKP